MVVRRFTGRVLSFRTTCERVMSDVWDDVTYAQVLGTDDIGARQLEEVCVGAASFDRELTSLGLIDAVDATPEVQAAAEEERQLLATYGAIRERLRAARAAAEKAVYEARLPRRGRQVVVARGRKVAKGTEGEVIWYGEGKAYGYGQRGEMRVGIKLASGEVVWTAAANVDVVGAPPAPVYKAKVDVRTAWKQAA